MNYLFLFTIPSVQEFISQARKTQDLFAGSQIFNELMIFAAKKFIESGGELIFPAYSMQILEGKITDLVNNLNFTNRFLGYWENIEKQEVEQRAKQIERITKYCWQRKSLNKIKSIVKLSEKTDNKFWDSVKKQLQTAFDIKWAAVPFDDNYAEAYLKLEQALGAVKDLRDLKNDNGESGRRCSVDGIRIVKFYRKKEKKDEEIKQNKDNKDNKNKPEAALWTKNNNDKAGKNKEEEDIFKNLPHWFRYTDLVYVFVEDFKDLGLRYIAPGEGLSAVSFARRLWIPDYQFPSTAEVAIWDDFILKFPELKEKEYKDFNEILKEKAEEKNLTILAEVLKEKNDFNFQWFLTQKEIENEDLKNEILEFRSDYELKPKGYYALIAFDGDSMGKHLSEIKTIKDHQEFSKKLSEFSNHIKKKVQYPNGKTIYSGGDDFLGFSTINNLKRNLTVTKNLFKLCTKNYNITGSFGVVIADYVTPLNQVITYAREALEEAKDRYAKPKTADEHEKDATGFVVFTGSKVVAQAFMKNSDVPKVFTVANLIAGKKLSRKFIFTFISEMTPILQEVYSYADFLTIRQALETELERLISRAAQGDKEQKKQTKEKALKSLKPFIEDNVIRLTPNDYTFDYQNITGIFKLIEQLSKHLTIAKEINTQKRCPQNT